MANSFSSREVNELEPEDMKEFLNDESERYLVVAFRGSQCSSCRWQLYYPNLLTYFFENENDVSHGRMGSWEDDFRNH